MRKGIFLTLGVALWGVAFLFAGYLEIAIGLFMGATATMGFSSGFAMGERDYQRSVRRQR